MNSHSDHIGISTFTGTEHTIGCLTLNRPQALNALSHAMIRTIASQLTAWEQDPALKAIVIEAMPGRAFCAGGDVKGLHSQARSDALQFFADEYRMNWQIAQLSKPYIALLDGLTMGGGAGVSIHGSHRLASEQFKFAMPETTIGFFPDIGASYFLSRLPGHVGEYLALTGTAISAADALAIGLLDALIPSTEFANAKAALADLDVDQVCTRFAQTPPASELSQHEADISAWFAADSIAAIIDNLTHDGSPRAQTICDQLATKSPTSLAVSLEQIRRGRHLATLGECLQMEFGLAQRFLQHPDFKEGVRAQLIDKDKQPHWQPATIAALEPAMIAHFFDHRDCQPLELGDE